MARKDRSVAERQKSLQPLALEPQFSRYGVRQMFENLGGKEINCTIDGYCRTQIFEFPRIDFRPESNEPHHAIYQSSSIQAYVVTDLLGYFENSSRSKHYAISPSLRYRVGETYEKIKLQQKDRVPVFLVIEESCQLTPVEMVKGECFIVDEVVLEDGQTKDYLNGGREGEQFITAHPTVDGAWPELPNNQQRINMILAGVRVGQLTQGPIHKYLDMDCLVTDDGRFVNMMRLTASARLSTTMPMDSTAYRAKVAEIRHALVAMERDLIVPHIALLFNAMYCDELKADSYQRLQYLALWQSLAEAGAKHLNYQGKNIREDKRVVAGKKTLLELRDYRDDIAHWWTNAIDGNFLADLQRTINELVRHKYF